MRWRWVAVAVFVLSSTLNYLDRQVLSVFAPYIVAHFHQSLTRFGILLSTFSIAYAAAALFAGWYLDRVGVNRAITVAVAWWSTAAISSGLATSFGMLGASRAALGIGEAAGVPAVGKLNGIYLKPEERALGAAVNQIGLSLGAALVPLCAYALHIVSWRVPFICCGVLGFVWIPLWALTSRRIRPHFGETRPARSADLALLRDRNLLLLVLANLCWMGSYSLWTNWGTVYYTRVYGLSVPQAASYLWIPPLISNAGGFFGGWLSYAAMKRNVGAVPARQRALWISTAGGLCALLLPAAAGPGWATVVVSASYFFALAGSVNLYALPIDLYGASRAGLGIAALTLGYGILQTVISPAIGWLTDHQLYHDIVWMTTAPLLLSALLLQRLEKQEPLARSDDVIDLRQDRVL